LRGNISAIQVLGLAVRHAAAAAAASPTKSRPAPIRRSTPGKDLPALPLEAKLIKLKPAE
jgi:hypothetical protein